MTGLPPGRQLPRRASTSYPWNFPSIVPGTDFGYFFDQQERLAMGDVQQSRTHRFSVQQYYELGELGLLDRRTELLEGIITDMEPTSPWHANIGDILLHFFVTRSQGRFRVRVQYPISLGQNSQPRPDLVLYRPGLWRWQHPGPADISLLIEISESSLGFDLGEKLALYGASGIQEYWVIDLCEAGALLYRAGLQAQDVK
jgi:Uma2 family endonuclease